MHSRHQQMFGILRFFSLASLVCILVAALLLALLYRHVAIQELRSFGERGNVLLADSLLDAMRPDIDAYLADEELHHGEPFPPGLTRIVTRMVQDSAVLRISLIDDEGIVLYSTVSDLIGQNRTGTEAYQVAINGQVYSRSEFRGLLRLFATPREGENVVISYVPVRNGPADPVAGIFTVYTDLTPMLAEVEKAELVIFTGSAGVMLLLYLVLVGIVRHAERIIQEQESTIRERSYALERLSAQLIANQEEERRRVARELHEGVAQTLGALKFRLEHAHGLLADKDASDSPELAPLVPLVQAAMQDVRALAMDIRPPGLDELGGVAHVALVLPGTGQGVPRHDIRLRGRARGRGHTATAQGRGLSRGAAGPAIPRPRCRCEPRRGSPGTGGRCAVADNRR
ncbi:MAG TPA: histidine kinase [Thioalkalivibrio sp.]|nr:histidine kinase [Thioalkalivibrio sp.]